ncbi:hypothetical protein [Pseudomonas sp. JUb52]|uniref:hypothetical protein n=1 Tax=Pseudomonas sp. JUb52 TaxID=2485127 RepID=UPI00105198A6|nr:hypothetical protein [Pseudomonas sp. JUb52]TCQ81604.1 hypothetical protein EC839_12611 [Pseudomonas sp. JUb52]
MSGKWMSGAVRILADPVPQAAKGSNSTGFPVSILAIWSLSNDYTALTAPGNPVYVVSAMFDTYQQLLDWYPDLDTAEGIRAAIHVHHDQKPEQPQGLNLDPVKLQAARTALTAQVKNHPCGIDAERCRSFVVAPGGCRNEHPSLPRAWRRLTT